MSSWSTQTPQACVGATPGTATTPYSRPSHPRSPVPPRSRSTAAGSPSTGATGARRFHLSSTHLEQGSVPAVQVAQAAEFLAGPARGRGADIALGDFNSAADGSTTATYAALTQRFRDAWLVNRAPGLTCCRNPTLTTPSPALATRIDLVLSRRGAKAVEAHRVGVAPFQASPPLWPSDHAGVVATLRLR